MVDAVLVGTKTSGVSGPLVSGAGTTTTGSTFIVCLSFDNGVTVSSVTDSKSNTYTLIGSAQVSAGVTHKKALYRCENGTGGASHTATAAFSGDPAGTIYLVEVTGAATASFDQTAQGTDTESPYTLTLPTLSQADEVIVTLFGTQSGGTLSYASSNTTLIGTESNGDAYWSSCVSKVVVSSTSAFSPSFTGGNIDTALIAGTFKATGGGGGGASQRNLLTLGVG